MSLNLYYNLAAKGAATPLEPPAGDDFATLVAATSPTAWWRLGESSGTNAVDTQGTQNGTYTGGPTLGISGITSDGDTGVRFAAASSQWVTIPDHAGLDVGTSDFSIMFGLAVNGSWPSTSQMVFYRGNTTGADDWGVYLRGAATGDIRLTMGSTIYTFSTGGSITWVDTGWHLVVLAVDRSASAHLYVDGSEVGSGIDVSGQVADSLVGTRAAAIASNFSGAAFLDHDLDEVAYWNGTLLTASDAAAFNGAL